MKKVCMLVMDNMKYHVRVHRNAKSLAEAGYEVTLFALMDKDTPAVEKKNGFTMYRLLIKTRFWRKNKITKILKAAEFFFKALNKAVKLKADVYHCVDLEPLMIMFIAAKINKAKVVYDAHELQTERSDISKWGKFLYYIYEKFFIKKVDLVIATSDMRAEFMQKKYSIKKPLVLLNVPEYRDAFYSNKLREIGDIAEDKKIILYQGMVAVGRGIEKLIESAKYLGENRLIVILGIGEEKYIERIKGIILEAKMGNKVKFIKGVSYNELLSFTASADMGIIPLEKRGLSFYYEAPNKLFETIMARIPVAASDFPEIRKVVKEYNVGVTFDFENPKKIADAIEEVLGNKYSVFKLNTERAVKELNWENEAKKLVKNYSHMLSAFPSGSLKNE